MSTTTTKPRVLLVDDEPHVLDGLRRNLARSFSVVTATGADEGLQRIANAGPFDVVVSDFRMPRQDGAEFLSQVRQQAPHTTRILLTGQADLEGAAAAVNEGGLFRFLLKPASSEVLTQALNDGVEHAKATQLEHDLLERTLRSSVRALTETLAMAAPDAFQRTSRLRSLAQTLVERAGKTYDWETDLTVTLSQIGAVSLPAEVIEKVESGAALTPVEQSMVARVPSVSAHILADIPRLEPVCEAIEAGLSAGDATPSFPGHVLRLVSDLDDLLRGGTSHADAATELRRNAARYDADLLGALGSAQPPVTEDGVVEVTLEELEAGMVLVDEVVTHTGVALVPSGQQITVGLVERIRNFAQLDSGIVEPLRVRPTSAER